VAAEVLGDRAQRHEFPRRPRRHLRPVVGDGEQDGPVLVVGVGVGSAVVQAGGHGVK